MRTWPFKVALSPDKPISGAILIDQIESVDRGRIVSPPVGRVDQATMANVRRRLSEILMIAPPDSF